MKRQITILLLCAVFPLIISCSKDHVEPDPDNQPSKESLQKDIQGKWIVETSSGRTTAGGSFLEFLSDSTYIVYNIADTLATGTFEATSGTEISLAKFGTISEIRFGQDKISFKLMFSNRILTISTVKSVIVDLSAKTKQLSRNWSLTNAEDGAAFFAEGSGIDRVTFRFSASGTYLAQMSSKGTLVEAVVLNWKWHSTQADRIVYWEDGNAINEDASYAIIRELTNDILKTTEHQPDGTVNYVFLPE